MEIRNDQRAFNESIRLWFLVQLVYDCWTILSATHYTILSRSKKDRQTVRSHFFAIVGKTRSWQQGVSHSKRNIHNATPHTTQWDGHSKLESLLLINSKTVSYKTWPTGKSKKGEELQRHVKVFECRVAERCVGQTTVFKSASWSPTSIPCCLGNLGHNDLWFSGSSGTSFIGREI